MRLYYVNDEYINKLREVDKKVLYNKNHKRPYIGVAAIINQQDYFIPMSSIKYNTNKQARKLNKYITINLPGEMGYIKFNAMIPVPLNELIEMNIDSFKEDVEYFILVGKQIDYIRKNEEKINKIASTVRSYDKSFNLYNILNNFEKLEDYCKKYKLSLLETDYIKYENEEDSGLEM